MLGMSELPNERTNAPDLSQTTDSCTQPRVTNTDKQRVCHPPQRESYDGCSLASSWSPSRRSRSQATAPVYHECDDAEVNGLCDPWSSAWRTRKPRPRTMITRPPVSEGDADSDYSLNSDAGDDIESQAEIPRIVSMPETLNTDDLKLIEHVYSEGRSEFFNHRREKTNSDFRSLKLVESSHQGTWSHCTSPPSPSCSPPDSPLRCASNLDGTNRGCSRDVGIQGCLTARDAKSSKAPLVEDSGRMTHEYSLHLWDLSPPSGGMACDVRRSGSWHELRSAGLPPVEASCVRTDGHSMPIEESNCNVEVCARKTTYHMTAFDFVCSEVLSRYSHILCDETISLVTYITNSISANSKSLFVRLYRRNPKWHTLESLAASYRDVDVPAAVNELARCKLILSTRAVMRNADASLESRVARSVLTSMNLDDLRSVCGVLTEGKKLQKRSRAILLPTLQCALNLDSLETSARSVRSCRAPRQMTIDGSCPARNLSRAVLSVSRVCIPRWVRNQLHRIHFLFFFEQGHDSANVILADTGKVRFPKYECIRKANPFPSRMAFEEYEMARSVLLTVSGLVDEYLWASATEWGSIAELELQVFARKHYAHGTWIESKRCRNCLPAPGLPSSCELSSCNTAQSAVLTAPRSRARNALYTSEMENQLLHPFFRQFSPVWVYARAAWRSVRALEALKMYETAVARLELLLRVDLLKYHRGKILDRLSINLVHLGRQQESLDLISRVLEESASSLHLGELTSLARRGVRLHERLRRTAELDGKSGTLPAKSKRRKLAKDATIASLPRAISNALLSLRYTVPVRKLKGRALPNIAQNGHMEPNADAKFVPDSWSDGTGQTVEQDDTRSTPQGHVRREVPNAPGAKSRFVGFSSNSLSVSVEELALEWYRGFAQWNGAHSEGSSVRFIWCLLFWECALFAAVPDVFQTPYQSSPLDLGTDSFYDSRRFLIESRLSTIRSFSDEDISEMVHQSYLSEDHHGKVCVGAAWDSFSADDLACIAGGMGSRAIAGCCELLCKDFSYWSSGLPDLVLWKFDMGTMGEQTPRAKLVEVKSQRDSLSTRQRAWLGKLIEFGVDCEVCKVVEKETKLNSKMLQESDLDPKQLEFLDVGEISKAGDSGLQLE